MLRKLNEGESWKVEEMQKEQLYFKVDGDKQPTSIVHHGTDKPYYAEELAQAIYKKKITELETLIKKLNEQLFKFQNQQGKGKRTNKKLMESKEKIFEWKNMGISNREIARRLNVSEGTIRNLLSKINY